MTIAVNITPVYQAKREMTLGGKNEKVPAFNVTLQ
jgi:hypothetical protein